MDRRFTGEICECGDPWCAGCRDSDIAGSSTEHFDLDFHAGEQDDDPEGDALNAYYASLPDDASRERGEPGC